ncbi:unnamed protein product [Oppiella nova]|uniref:Uncharacterized protein n=1 Tax=Oppiella nova TaxID=334625 RepID=A0A7R9ML81_9ACAR|nr:unnamed protein product [Oppiella nova]CAG2179462.1 unnamed protein product [Oppiella nova]
MKSIVIILATLALIDLNEAAGAQTVELSAYIESLCPDSRNFINNQLKPVYDKLKAAEPQILTINLVPFGNAKLTFVSNSTVQPKLTFTCQHKAAECDGNIIQPKSNVF